MLARLPIGPAERARSATRIGLVVGAVLVAICASAFWSAPAQERTLAELLALAALSLVAGQISSRHPFVPFARRAQLLAGLVGGGAVLLVSVAILPSFGGHGLVALTSRRLVIETGLLLAVTGYLIPLARRVAKQPLPARPKA